MSYSAICDIMAFGHFDTLDILGLVPDDFYGLLAILLHTLWPMVWRPEVLGTQYQFTRLSSLVTGIGYFSN